MLGAIFCLMCLFVTKTAEVANQKPPRPVHQKSISVSANVGQKVTLECVYDSAKLSWLYWYRQTLGKQPELMTSVYHYNQQISFYGEFQNNSRFASSSNNGANRLVISNLKSSDSGTYYCARGYSSVQEFAEGTAVLVQGPGEGFPVRVQQWASGSAQRGGSVTLQCRVETGSCAGGARVYWLRESRQAEVGILFGSQQECVRNANTQTHSCLYTLPMSLDPSHTGVYYCAVAWCGRILFGNGTKLDFGTEAPAAEGHSPALVTFLGAALAFTSVLSLSLASSLCVLRRRIRWERAEPPSVYSNVQ